MAWFPIANVVPQYWKQAADGTNEYSGAVLKAYQVGTLTNIPFATDNTGDTTANSIALNANGNPEVSGNVVIPHLDQDYKLAFYPDQASADADSGAIWTQDDLDLMGFDAGLLNPEHATDSGTDTYVSATDTDVPSDGVKITRDFQSANTTTTPTLDGVTMKTRDGSALWAGAINGTHELYYNGTDYLVLDPLGTLNNRPLDVDDLAANGGTVPETSGGGFPNVNTDVTATTADMNSVLTSYSSEWVELGGDFAEGESVFCERIGKTVTITTSGSLAHSSSSNPNSSAGAVPSAYRPSSAGNVVNVYSFGISTMNLVRVDNGGNFNTIYRDYTGSLSARTDTDSLITLSYVIVDEP